ncbi:hypothetical protein BV25DRAFT_1180381 [Artomyces pyxidatus]|uniref:Uncharacterized protein n=2 Tax=Artomyces pyxidatus TaxID=48021 RepID=A0ACB8SPU5_9AGAM|nr:hypothetical protein BV25DRAFT_1222497 [Artomyces pyxidatus]KAI0059023.1 hypothetical protein BV25DRAFT_1180381 [Artomyces pyxidatus]
MIARRSAVGVRTSDPPRAPCLAQRAYRQSIALSRDGRQRIRYSASLALRPKPRLESSQRASIGVPPCIRRRPHTSRRRGDVFRESCAMEARLRSSVPWRSCLVRGVRPVGTVKTKLAVESMRLKSLIKETEFAAGGGERGAQRCRLRRCPGWQEESRTA